MEKISYKHETLDRALYTLEQSITDLTTKEHGSNEYLTYRDSTIKRFEYCYELLWKYLKLYLEKKHGTFAPSPRTVFRECFATNITNEAETEQLLEMIKARNNTSHMYNDQFAEKLVQQIPSFYTLMQSIAQRTRP